MSKDDWKEVAKEFGFEEIKHRHIDSQSGAYIYKFPENVQLMAQEIQRLREELNQAENGKVGREGLY